MPKTKSTNAAFEEQQLEPNTLVYEDEADDYGYVHLSKLVLYAANLSKDAKILYAYLRGYAYEKDHCFPGYPTLAKDLGTTRKTVIGYMKELEDANLIYKKRRGQGKTNIYVILSLSKAKIQVQEHHRKSRSVKITLQEGTETTLQEGQNLHPNNEELKELKEEEVYLSNIRKAENKEKNSGTSRGRAEEPEGSPPSTQENGGHSTTGQAYKNPAAMSLNTEGRTQVRNIEELEAIEKYRRSAAKFSDNNPPPSMEEQTRRGGLAHIGQTLQGRMPVAPPAVDDAVARDAIESYIRDIAAKLHDEAPLKSSTTRAFNLYRQAGIDLGSFFNLLYDAEKEANRRSATIKKLTSLGFKNRMAYFFAVLEDKLGFREKPLTNAPHSR